MLRFGAGIAPADIVVSRNGVHLVLSHANGSDRVTVENWYTTAGSAANQVERVEFADGTVWTNTQLTEQGLVVTGTAGNDALSGLAGFANTLYGMAGADALTGGNAVDLLFGGTGSDTLNGGTGNDEYRYLQGDGYDTLVTR